MKRIWYNIKLVYCLVRMFISPGNTDAVLALGENSYQLGYAKEFLTRVAREPESAKVIQDRKLLKPFHLLELQKLPEGTLGRVYADHMISSNLNPDFYKVVPIIDDQIFCMMRLRQSHDLWHIITGFDTSVEGEVGLQSFYYNQTCAMMAPFVVGGAILNACFKRRYTLVLIFENIVRGWMMGKKAKPLFPVDWESHWLTPIEDLKKLLL